jgi:hypothetical protein
MRNNFVESAVIGSSIAFGVLAIHALTDSTPAQLQLMALVLAGVALFCVQLAFTIRRIRHSDAPAEEQPEAERPARLRPDRRNPFFRELTHDWTGLEEHTVQRAGRRAQPPGEQASEVWDERPTSHEP